MRSAWRNGSSGTKYGVVITIRRSAWWNRYTSSSWAFSRSKPGPLGSTWATEAPAGSGTGGSCLRTLGEIAGLEVPVLEKDGLELEDDRPRHPRDQFLVGKARHEAGIHQVLGAGVADPPVDDCHLAMIPEVEPRGAPPEEPGRQRLAGGNAGRRQPGEECLELELPGTDGVDQHAALDAARLRAEERLRPRARRVVVREDVVQQVDVLSRAASMSAASRSIDSS